MISALFWFSTVTLLYITVGYPLLIWLRATLHPRRIRKASAQTPVTVVLVAYNEAAALERKIENVLSSTYATRITRLLVVSDGSTDDTDTRMERLANPRVEYLRFPDHRGKASALTDAIGSIEDEILVFVDVRQRLEADAIERLVENFADPEVGVVSGRLEFDVPPLKGPNDSGMGSYWSYEAWVRHQESRVHSVPGATGALYAVRRSCLRPPPADIVLDDVVIPMCAVEAGYRCVLEPAARVYDLPPPFASDEMVRKRRTLAGCYQLVRRYPRWMIPGRHPIWWQFASHKVLRLLTPFLLLTLLLASGALATQAFYRAVLAIGCMVVILGLAGFAFPPGSPGARWLRGPHLLLRYNGILLLAAADGLTGRYEASWGRNTFTD